MPGQDFWEWVLVKVKELAKILLDLCLENRGEEYLNVSLLHSNRLVMRDYGTLAAIDNHQSRPVTLMGIYTESK